MVNTKPASQYSVISSCMETIEGACARTHALLHILSANVERPLHSEPLWVAFWRLKVAWAILLILCFCGSTYAQGPTAGSSEGNPQVTPTQPSSPQATIDLAPKRLLNSIWTDQKAMWTSPFRMNRRQWVTIALPLAAGTAALIATDQDAAKWLPNTADQVKWSQRVSNIGAAYTLGGLVGGTMLGGWKAKNAEVFDMGRSSARALADSIIINYALKLAAGRERPLENDGQGRFWKGSNSFPSGHAMDSFAVAMVIARHPKSPTWLKVTSLAVATTVSLSRWGARKHFPSDIFVGGVLGGLIGNYVATHPR